MSSNSLREQFSYDSANTQLISKLRMLLAAAILAVTYIDPSEPRRFVVITYSALATYAVYSVIIFSLSRQLNASIPINKTHWIDTGWYLFFIALSGGTSSIFFFLLFFSILNASFRFGFNEGFRLTVVSAVLFTIVGYLTSPSGEEFELNRFLIRPVYLTILGYMMSYWGERELIYKHRLQILRDINKLYNPRFGIDQTMSSIMRKITSAFRAESCLLISVEQDSLTYSLRQSDSDTPEKAIYAEQIAADHPLTAIQQEHAVIYYKAAGWWDSSKYYVVFDSESGKFIEQPMRNGEVLADFLETNSFISVPLYQRNVFIGRLFLIRRSKSFDFADIEFLHQLLDNVVSVVENVTLLDRLASEATEQQRQKISRDIHDSTVQPYIGIKFGLEALQLKLASGENIEDEIKELINIAETNISDIRSYINNLKNNKPQANAGNTLITAIKQQAKKIGEFYGIRIEVVSEEHLVNMSDRLAAEVFQMVTEGLSNIKRHTKADRALIDIECGDKMLKFSIQNNNANGTALSDFVPKSLNGRANSLGGRATVENSNNHTKVTIEIPL